MDILCFSHIKWNFVYQRPQHLLSRFACYNRVFIIEEPMYNQKSNNFTITDQKENNIYVIVLNVTGNAGEQDSTIALKELMNSFIASAYIRQYLFWYYTPMALDYSQHLAPKLIIYDCMDELSAFKFAPSKMKEYEAKLFLMADLVFTGGHSLYQAKKHLHDNIHSFPSSIDKAHFSKARNTLFQPTDQKNIPHPRIGFYGVLDERLDIELLRNVATAKPNWNFILIGPVIKIDQDTLPVASNIHYLGAKTYQELSSYLSGWDIAILPFELNESTKYISPTKTPEYLAGGKPVISSSITDVVSPYGDMELVEIADTSTEFIEKAEKILRKENYTEWLKKVDTFLNGTSWNNTWHQMSDLIDKELDKKQFSFGRTVTFLNPKIEEAG